MKTQSAEHKMRLDRLTRLADFLEEEVPDKQFTLTSWFYGDFESRDCGTAACALGWSTVLFRKEGVRRYVDSHGFVHVWFGDALGYDAGAALFGISYNQSNFLFSPARYEQLPFVRPTRRDVIARIREFVADNRGRLEVYGEMPVDGFVVPVASVDEPILVTVPTVR